MQVVDKDGNIFGPGIQVNGADGKPKTTGGGGGSPSGPAGGDLTGSYPNPSITWINGLPTYDLSYYPLALNPAGYITSGALSPYLTSSLAASTYTPLTRDLTINGVTQDLSTNRTWTVTAPDPAGWTTIVKSANQDVTNSSVMVDATDLQFSVVAGGHYMVEMDMVISANNAVTGKYKHRFLLSAGTMKGQGVMLTNSNGGVGSAIGTFSITSTTSDSTIGTALSDIDMLFSFKILYSFTASANATFKYQFANGTAGAGFISRTWKGSILKYKRID